MTFKNVNVLSKRSDQIPIAGAQGTMTTNARTTRTTGTTSKKETSKKAMDRPMKVVGKKYASVSELVRDTAEPEVANEFDKYQAARRLVNCLTVIRCVNGVSQATLA